jgi:hypothetical protein
MRKFIHRPSYRFLVGILIGAMALLPLPRHALAASASPALVPDNPCFDITDQPQEVIDYANVLCTVWQAMFNDGSSPGLGFGFVKDIAQPGKYTGNVWDGREVGFEAVMVVNLDLKTNAPELYEQGVVARGVVGRLSGVAGGVTIAGVVIVPKGITADDRFVLQVVQLLSSEDYATYTRNARIESGVRVLDVNTWKSIPLSEVTSASSLSASSDDLGSLYGTDVNVAGAGGAVDTACVQRAYAAYAVSAQLARDNLETCMISAIRTFAICMAAAIAVSIWGTPAATVIASLACVAYEAERMATCVSTNSNAMRAAQQTLNNALRACGMNVALMET